MPTSKPKSKEADWSPEKTLPLLREQLEELQKLRGRQHREVEREEDTWRQFTRNLIVHGFGESSNNLTEFNLATWAGEHNVMGVSEQQSQINFELRVERYQATLQSSIKELEATVPAPESRVADSKPRTHQGLLVFISHSSKDAVLALALIELLKAGLGLLANQIRCSSVDGYRLPVGVNTESKLREEVNAAKLVIGLITPSSLSSYYVMFELGARWGADLFLAPILAGVKASELSGPLSLLNALSANSEPQLHQLLDDVSKQLGLPLQNAASYLHHVAAVKALADSILNASPPPAVAVAPKPDLKVSFSAEGTPPTQVVKVIANQSIRVSRLDYMLSTEASIVSEEVTLEGETLDVPLNHDALTKLWNAPRADRNHYDHSGPAKVGVTVSFDGKTRQFIIPIVMDNLMQNSSMYRRVVGSRTFYGDSGT